MHNHLADAPPAPEPLAPNPSPEPCIPPADPEVIAALVPLFELLIQIDRRVQKEQREARTPSLEDQDDNHRAQNKCQ